MPGGLFTFVCAGDGWGCVESFYQGSNNLHFYYDASSKPAMVDFNGVTYGYVHNLQGDIVAIVNGSGTVVVSYTYDAWGKPLSKTGTLASTLGSLNPFRYRGYVYDEETGMYYLRSRYYSASMCRFLNADSVIGRNLFAYCANMPIIASDPAGAETLVQPFAKMGVGNLVSAMYYDGTCGAAIADVINPPQSVGFDGEAVDAYTGAISEELFGVRSLGDMPKTLIELGGLRFSAKLVAGGYKVGGLVGAIAAGFVSIIVMISATGIGTEMKEYVDGLSPYQEEEFSEDVLSGITDIPLEFVDINTGYFFLDFVIDKTIGHVKTFFVETAIP